MLARPPLREAAPGVVLPPAGWHDQVRGEPAEEVPGHLPAQLRLPGLARPVAGVEARLPLLDRPGRADVPRRYPAHQARRLLGMAARRDQARPPGRPLPRRSLPPP